MQEVQMHLLLQIKSYRGTNVSVLKAVIAYLLTTAETTTLQVGKKSSFLSELLSEISSMNSTHKSIPENVTLGFTPHKLHPSHRLTNALPMPVWGQVGPQAPCQTGLIPTSHQEHTGTTTNQQTHCDNMVWPETSFEHKPELFLFTSAHKPASHA